MVAQPQCGHWCQRHVNISSLPTVELSLFPSVCFSLCCAACFFFQSSNDSSTSSSRGSDAFKQHKGGGSGCGTVSAIALNGSLLEIPRALPGHANNRAKRAAGKKESICQRTAFEARREVITNTLGRSSCGTLMAVIPEPVENPWNSYMTEIYLGRHGPQPLGTVIFEEIEELARKKLEDHRDAFLFAAGNAGSGATYRSNIKAFEKWAILPQMLTDASKRDLSTTIFGKRYSCPVILAPIGLQGIFSKNAELDSARAAKALGMPFILSTSTTRTPEEVAEANGDGSRWFQLYRPRSDEITLSLLARAKACKYSVLVLTVDSMVIGWRPHDLATSYLPLIHGYGTQIGLSDPVFMSRHGKSPIVGPCSHPVFPYDSKKLDRMMVSDPNVKEIATMGREWLKELESRFRTWEDLDFLRENWDGPLVLKGIQTLEDAIRAIDYGVNGIIVSNHGGRQVDGAIPSLLALEKIMESPSVRAAVESGDFTVLFDSGIRTGPDIFKAIALGAQGVLLGRPWLYGSIIAGQAGIEQVIRHTVAELHNILGQTGHSSLDTIRGKSKTILVNMNAS